MELKSDLDYVEFYAEKLRENNKFFEHHKKFIESQLHSSSSVFKNKFGKHFKKNARKYLREIGMIE